MIEFVMMSVLLVFLLFAVLPSVLSGRGVTAVGEYLVHIDDYCTVTS